MTFKPFFLSPLFAIIILFPLFFSPFFLLFFFYNFFYTGVFSFCRQLPHQSSDSERTQSEDHEGDFMDITIGSDNLLLLASLSSYASAATDDISIIGNVADPSMVHAEIVEIGEIGTAVDPSPAPSASIVERETGVPLLVLEEVTDGDTT